MLTPVSLKITILVKQPLLPITTTITNKIIPIIIPSFLNLPKPKTTLTTPQPKPNLKLPETISIKQPILPNTPTTTITPTTDNT